MSEIRETQARDLPLIDDAMLTGLRDALGAGTDALVAKAAEVVTERMDRIAALAADAHGGETTESLATLAHEVGGVSGQVGMAKLSAEALALERLCRGDGEADPRAAVESLSDTARRSLEAIGRI